MACKASRKDIHNMAVPALSYSRVSSKEQEEGFSLESQNRTAQQHAASKGLKIVHAISVSESAKKEGRRHFNEMIDYLREHREVRVVIVEKSDRLYRNLHDVVAIEDLVNELDIEIHFVREGQVLNKSSRSQDKLVQGMFALMARNYILNMREEIVKGQTVKAEKGQYPGRAPWGYQHDRAARTIVADPERSEVVKSIFTLCAEGTYTIKALRRAILDKHGLRISKSGLHGILTSRFYIGFFTWRGREYQGTHPKLVDEQTFDRVQEIVSGKSKSKPRKHKFAFAGLMQCLKDGCRITAEVHKQHHTYYHCSFGQGRHKFPYLKEERVALLLGSALKSLRLPTQSKRGMTMLSLRVRQAIATKSVGSTSGSSP